MNLPFTSSTSLQNRLSHKILRGFRLQSCAEVDLNRTSKSTPSISPASSQFFTPDQNLDCFISTPQDKRPMSKSAGPHQQYEQFSHQILSGSAAFVPNSKEASKNSQDNDVIVLERLDQKQESRKRKRASCGLSKTDWQMRDHRRRGIERLISPTVDETAWNSFVDNMGANSRSNANAFKSMWRLCKTSSQQQALVRETLTILRNSLSNVDDCLLAYKYKLENQHLLELQDSSIPAVTQPQSSTSMELFH